MAPAMSPHDAMAAELARVSEERDALRKALEAAMPHLIAAKERYGNHPNAPAQLVLNAARAALALGEPR